MSTYIHLQCLSHHPPLVAESESGQHLYDLPQLREDIANRDLIVQAAKSWHLAGRLLPPQHSPVPPRSPDLPPRHHGRVRQGPPTHGTRGAAMSDYAPTTMEGL